MGRKRIPKKFKLQKIEEFKTKIESHKCYCKLIPEICEEIGVKYETFKKWFKEIKGLSLRDFCNKCKLKYAKYLLLETKDKIYIIANLISFRNARHFIDWFKNKMGITPKKYRNTELTNRKKIFTLKAYSFSRLCTL